MTLTGDQTSGLVRLGQSLLCKDAPAVPHVQDGETTQSLSPERLAVKPALGYVV